MQKIAISALATLAAATLAGGVQAQTITNGGFESGIANPGAFTTLGAGDTTSMTGWTVNSGTVDYIGNYWQDASASGTGRSVDLSGGGAGSISTTITNLIAGQDYEITFFIAGNPDVMGEKSLTAKTTEFTANPFTFNSTGKSLGNMGWESRSFRFVADSTTTLLTFTSNTPTAYGPALDNVSIAAVPEASTWAMMLIGFGGIGGAMRRRKASNKLATA